MQPRTCAHCNMRVWSDCDRRCREERSTKEVSSYRNGGALCAFVAHVAAFQPIQRMAYILHQLGNGLIILRVACRHAARCAASGSSVLPDPHKLKLGAPSTPARLVALSAPATLSRSRPRRRPGPSSRRWRGGGGGARAGGEHCASILRRANRRSRADVGT